MAIYRGLLGFVIRYDNFFFLLITRRSSGFIREAILCKAVDNINFKHNKEVSIRKTP